MFGGQSLQPAGAQDEYQDMWILTLPAFTWIEVDQSNQSIPYGRSGHTCNVWDGQMVVVGGYVGTELSCETPGIYVFDLSNCEWVQQFTALSPGTDTGSDSSSSGSSGSSASAGSGSTSTATGSGSSSTSSASSDFNSTGSNNPLNQQPAQLANGTSSGGLEGSYGYTVPQIVIDVIGGNANGSATVTAPIETATAGPLATGKPITYTVTGANGATTTETATPGSSGNGNGNGSTTSSSSSGGGGGPNIAAIVVGVICGILFFVVCYLAFCAYVYRRQLKLYKRHVEMSQRQARGEKVPAIPGLLGTDSPKNSADRARLGAAEPAWVQSESASQRTGGAYSGGQTSSSAPGATTGNTSGASGYQSVRRESDQSSTDDLMANHEPTFVGVLLNPRRSLKVVNRD